MPSGLQYKVLSFGEGERHPGLRNPCKCHYEGRLIDGTVFDSTYGSGEPIQFSPNEVIKGWKEAMQLMTEGDKWELYIPSELAYGEKGHPPKIGGGEALIFTLELISIEPEKNVEFKLCSITHQDSCSEEEKKFIREIQKLDVDEAIVALEELSYAIKKKKMTKAHEALAMKKQRLLESYARNEDTMDEIQGIRSRAAEL